jgi:hypothetical protein
MLRDLPGCAVVHQFDAADFDGLRLEAKSEEKLALAFVVGASKGEGESDLFHVGPARAPAPRGGWPGNPPRPPRPGLRRQIQPELGRARAAAVQQEAGWWDLGVRRRGGVRNPASSVASPLPAERM